MKNIAELLSKWAFAIVLCLIAVALLCAGGCTIYTAIERPLLGIIGTIGVSIASVPSALFRADINYEPNSVDDLRWAISEIRNLKAQIAQMKASETNLTE